MRGALFFSLALIFLSIGVSGKAMADVKVIKGNEAERVFLGVYYLPELTVSDVKFCEAAIRDSRSSGTRSLAGDEFNINGQVISFDAEFTHDEQAYIDDVSLKVWRRAIELGKRVKAKKFFVLMNGRYNDLRLDKKFSYLPSGKVEAYTRCGQINGHLITTLGLITESLMLEHAISHIPSDGQEYARAVMSASGEMTRRLSQLRIADIIDCVAVTHFTDKNEYFFEYERLYWLKAILMKLLHNESAVGSWSTKSELWNEFSNDNSVLISDHIDFDNVSSRCSSIMESELVEFEVALKKYTKSGKLPSMRLPFQGVIE